MNWYTSCAYNDDQKRAFHATGRKRLKSLAAALGFEPGSYDLRSNLGGIAVSGEVTMHHERPVCADLPACDRIGQRHPDPHLRRTKGLHRRPQSLRALVLAR